MQKPPTEGSWRNYIMRHACLASWRDKTTERDFTPDCRRQNGKIRLDPRIYMQIYFLIMTISRLAHLSLARLSEASTAVPSCNFLILIRSPEAARFAVLPRMRFCMG